VTTWTLDAVGTEVCWNGCGRPALNAAPMSHNKLRAETNAPKRSQVSELSRSTERHFVQSAASGLAQECIIANLILEKECNQIVPVLLLG